MIKFILLFSGSLIIIYIWFTMYKIIEAKIKEDFGLKTDIMFISSVFIVDIFGSLAIFSSSKILIKMLIFLLKLIK